jgi:glycosyltransferase involved in cell wall biosynthesis
MSTTATSSESEVKRLLIVTRVTHYRHEGTLYAYGAYAREIDIWADLFPEIVIASSLQEGPPASDCTAFTRQNISVLPVLDACGDTWVSQVWQFLSLPLVVWQLAKYMRTADAIHVRCPCDLGFLGTLMAPLFSRCLVAKYANQWNGYEGERFVVRAQRAVLASRWWCGPVTVYGRWPNQPPHVIPFFTSVMTADMVQSAVRAAEARTIHSPLRVLFSGRLSPEKRIGTLLEAAGLAIQRGVPLELVLVGDGPEANRLREQAKRLGLGTALRFVGGLPFEESLKWNEWADCLVLPSMHNEGWPKVVAEAMCYGLVCIAGAHGQVPDMLDGRGIALAPCTPEQITDSLCWIARHPAEALAMGQRASLWAKGYSLEGLRDALHSLLENQWHRKLRSVPSASALKPEAT